MDVSSSNYHHPRPWDTPIESTTMPALLARAVAAHPDRTLIDFLGRKLSYQAMHAEARRFAAGLQAAGIGRGDRVGLFLPNVPIYLSAYYGAMMAGATVVNFSPLYSVDELSHQVEDSGTRLLVTVDANALYGTAQAVLEGSLDPTRTIQIGIRGGGDFLWEFSYQSGMTVIHAEEVAELGLDAVIARALEVVGAGPTYVSFDVDSLDPGFAPGTGTPEVGGLEPREVMAILRGLKEKYEQHHQVRISDSALVAAAQLSNRYITDRFLPDKAIDLVDEAASRLRMEVDSKPEELDQLDRNILQLQIEAEALKKEDDAASKDRLEKLEGELSALQEQSASMTAKWQAERAKLEGARELKEQLDRARADLDIAKREGNLAKAGELSYGVIPDLERKLSEAEKAEEEGDVMVEEAVRPEQIAQVVERWTGIPTSKMLEGEREKLLRMEEGLHKRVIGQDQAVRAVANAVRRARAGLNDEARPLGSFLFLGPTGVGKTELTKAVAEFLFDDDSAMVRIDMSEFMEKHAVARLIGAPPGYVGYDEGGVLTEAVRRKPYQVVLFDEVEKAHPDVFNVLLQVLDDGVLTDGQGHRVDFKQTLIVLTSNLGSQALSQLPDGADAVKAKQDVMDAVRAHFRPEFLNRLDETVIFDRLGRADMSGIVDIQLGLLAKRLAKRNITLTLDDDAKQWLGDQGYDPVYGARPLKRVIQKALQDPLAEMILSGDVLDGATIPVTAGADGLIIGDRVGNSTNPKPNDAVVH